MKKIIVIMLVCLLVLLTACGSKSAIQEATGANSKQNITITETLESVGIDYEIINESNHNMPTIEIPEGLKTYNIIDRDAVNYFLILNGDLKVVAILDKDSNIMYGSVA